MESRKSSVFVLLLLGGLFVLMDGVITAAMAATAFLGIFPLSFMCRMCFFFPNLLVYSSLIGIVSGILIVYSSAVIRENKNKRVLHTYATVALISSAISLLNGGGFLIGFILSLVGSVVALLK
ncbi:MAG: hypothetical protein QXL16_01960 [Candidatus Micrarchaeaceae archaeon]